MAGSWNRQKSDLADSPIGRAVQRTLLANAVALAKAPKVAADVAGKVWNAPNTALGLGYGLAGYAAGQLNRLRPGDQPNDPRIQFGHNAVEFINNPWTTGAITLGNTVSYKGDPYDPHDDWRLYKEGYGHPIQEHEKQHTYQGQQLGPLYLPSNIAGLALSMLRGEKDDINGSTTGHGISNWNERGPQMNPPRPWAARSRP